MHLYFLLNERTGLLKIGVTSDVDRRRRELENAGGVPLCLLGFVPGSRRVEASCHEILAHWRKEGEWFAYRTHVRAFVKSALSFGIAQAISSFDNVELNRIRRAIRLRGCRQPSGQPVAPKQKFSTWWQVYELFIEFGVDEQRAASAALAGWCTLTGTKPEECVRYGAPVPLLPVV